MLKKILDNLILLPEHRESLKTKRGFTDDVIDKMQFKSCGPHVKDQQWFQEIPENYQKILLNDNIAIPYFDPEGNPIYLRAHKYGPEGEPVHVYVPWEYMEDNIKTLVITEGEFKAVASCVMGVPCIGLPGVASFSKANYNKLVQLINQLEPDEIVICFDNEIKDNPKLPNYKPDFRKRYDTQFFAYVMGHQLNNVSKKKTRIATLPKEWINGSGKIDIDGVLARSDIKKDNYKNVIMHKSLPPTEYKRSWVMPKIHASFLERKLDKFFYHGPVKEEFNCYFLREGNGENVKFKPISNFVIKIKYTMYDEDGKLQRMCQFLSKYGDSYPAMFHPDVMVSKASFQKWCYEMGDFPFDGSEEQLKMIWKYMFMNQDGRLVKLLHHYGYDEESKIWFFNNGAYHNDVFQPYSEDGIVWVDDMGYKIQTDMQDIDPPSLCENSESNIEISEIVASIATVLGEDHAKLLVGWTLGNFFMPEILKEYGIYPFLFLYGRQAGGKSTIANWISSFFGFSQKGINFHSSSVVGISRMASQMSMVPLWLEEYRIKDPDIGRKNNYLRGIYDRSTIVKGTKNVNQVKTYTARSTLIISGEEHPRDAALNSRCLMFSIFRGVEKQNIGKEFKWLEANKTLFNNFGHEILTNKKSLWPKVDARIKEYIKSFDDEHIAASSRNKVQMSIISGIVDTMIGSNDKFCYFVAEKAKDMERGVMDDQALSIFFDDIYNMYNNNKFKGKIFDVKWQEGKHVMTFWFSGAYAEWEIYYKGLRNDLPCGKAALLEHLKREGYFIKFQTARMNKNVLSCAILDVKHENFPDTLRMLTEQIKPEEEEDEGKPITVT